MTEIRGPIVITQTPEGVDQYNVYTADPRVTYFDEFLITENTNPILLDSRGECNVWIGDGKYQFVVADADNIALEFIDDIVSLNETFAQNPLRFFDFHGDRLSNGKLYTYYSGTSTPAPTYTDSTGDTLNDNPVILDASGEAVVFIDPDIVYKYILKTADDVTIWTVGGIQGTSGAVNATIVLDPLTLSATGTLGADLFVFTDDFNRANGQVGSDWEGTSPTAYLLVIDNGFSTNYPFTNGAVAMVSRSVHEFAADQYAEMTIATQGTWDNPYMGPAVRIDLDNAAHGYYVECNESTVYSVRKYGNQHGSFAIIETTSVYPVLGDVVKLQISGITLSLYVNGSLIWSGDDSDISEGQPGIRLRWLSTSDFKFLADDFTGAEI